MSILNLNRADNILGNQATNILDFRQYGAALDDPLLVEIANCIVRRRESFTSLIISGCQKITPVDYCCLTTVLE